MVSKKIDNLENQSGYTLGSKVWEFCDSLGWKSKQYFDVEKNVAGKIRDLKRLRTSPIAVLEKTVVNYIGNFAADQIIVLFDLVM